MYYSDNCAIVPLGQKGHNGENPPPWQKELDIHPFQSQYMEYMGGGHYFDTAQQLLDYYYSRFCKPVGKIT